MMLRVEDIALVLEHVALPQGLVERLRRVPVELEISNEEIAALNDACISYVQEQGFDPRGSATDIARRLEQIVDALNED
jgi:hypothetical protein